MTAQTCPPTCYRCIYRFFSHPQVEDSYRCRAPQNKLPHISLVTGEAAPRFGSCLSAREFQTGCGPAGQWYKPIPDVRPHLGLAPHPQPVSRLQQLKKKAGISVEDL